MLDIYIFNYWLNYLIYVRIKYNKKLIYFKNNIFVKMIAFRSNNNTIKLWDTLINKEITTLIGHTDGISSVCFSPTTREGPCGNILASRSCDNTIKIWDTLTNKEITTLHGHNNFVSALCFSPTVRDGQCGKMLASP